MAGSLVVGCGHPDRGDDAVGLLVADAIRRAAPTVEVLDLLDPLRLVSVVHDHDLVVAVDAATGAGPPGTIRVHEVADAPLPVAAARPTSTHGFALSDAIELCRVAGLPCRLVVVTVTGSRFAVGSAPQDAVRDAVGPAVTHVLDLIEPERGASLRREGRG